MSTKEVSKMSAKGGEFFIGLAIGALAGAAAALFLAPTSGEELRKQIGDMGIELKGQVEKLAEDAKTQAQQQAEYVQEQGRIVLTENVKKAQQVVHDTQSKLSKPGDAAVPSDAPV
jgi:gas vesicle protein